MTAYILPPTRDPLPIDDALPKLEEAIRCHSAVVLCAPPGSGKTTRVPLAMLQLGLVNHGNLILLEPRRIAARAVATFMASSLGQEVGQTVGYQIRFDKKISTNTKIHVMTEGMLSRHCMTDPLLEGTDMVIIDEFHERSVNVDLALCFLKETMTVRDDIKIIVMSATINAAQVSQYLNDCPVINIDTKPFPLDIVYEEKREQRPVVERMYSTICRALKTHPQGDVLAFLPGAYEIELLRSRLGSTPAPDVEVIPLYGALTSQNQDKALRPAKNRRVVLATNIAETSLTIPGVHIVIDSGLEKRIEWRGSIGLEKLTTGTISQFSATQRSGRAAREGPGTVYRMWTASQNREHPQRSVPEIARVDPISTVFTLITAWSTAPQNIDLLTTLNPHAVDNALSTLRLLQLVSHKNFSLTEIGKQAAAFPLHPRLALIVLGAASMGKGKEGATAAAILNERDILLDSSAPRNTIGECDIAIRIRLLQQFQQQGATTFAARQLGLHFHACKMVLASQSQLLRILSGLGVAPRSKTANYLMAGFLDRVCKNSNPTEAHAIMATGRGVTLSKRSIVSDSRLFVALDAVAQKRADTTRSEITVASEITETDLQHFGKHLFTQDQQVLLDETKDTVLAMQITRYMQLEMNSQQLHPIPIENKALRLYEHIQHNWQKSVAHNESFQNDIARYTMAQELFPKYPLPKLLVEEIGEFVLSHCYQVTRPSQLGTINWVKQIIAQLDYATQQFLEQMLPFKYVMPSGRYVEIDYTHATKNHALPMIRARLQELFGLVESPKIANGRVSLSIGILAPNGREVQITSDLGSFWHHTYPEIRKELRARYAKHFWPENPLCATATHLTKKQFARKNKP